MERSHADAAGAAGAIEVACIIGFGRSGSTVFDTVLGNHPGLESFGELVNLPTMGWTNNEYCACGVRVRECPFWSQIHERALAAGFPADPAAYVALQGRFERGRSLPRLLCERRRPSEDFRRYAEWTRILYATLREASGASLLVDSSKHPVRAFALSLIPGLDVRMLHLIRDPRGVAWSLLKSYKRDDAAGVQFDIPVRPARTTALEWVHSNFLAALVRRLASGPEVEIRYEDLMADPAAILADVGRVLGVDLQPLGERVLAGDAMSVGHTVAGNRLRMQGSVRLQPDVEWRTRLPASDRRIVQLLTAPLMIRFGYKLGSP